MKSRITTIALLLSLLVFDVHAQATSGDRREARGDARSIAVEPIDWSTLSASQQQFLQPIAPLWDTLEPPQHGFFARLAASAPSWNEERRALVRTRIEQWAAMTPEQRARTRARFEWFRDLREDERERVREAYQRFRELSPEQRRELRERYRELKPARE